MISLIEKLLAKSQKLNNIKEARVDSFREGGEEPELRNRLRCAIARFSEQCCMPAAVSLEI